MDKKQVNSIFSSLRQKHYQQEGEENNYSSIDILSEDPQMKMLIQKINKKSQKTTTTRKKSLEEMLMLLKQKDADYLKKFVKMFLLIFEKFIQAENNKEILMMLNELVAVFIEKNVKTIKKNFDQFFHLLFFNSFNDIEEISFGAKKNLNNLLKTEQKQSQAFAMFFKQYIDFITPYIQDNKSHFDNISIYQNEETDKIIFQRNKAIVFNSLAEALNLSKFFNEDQSKEITPILISQGIPPSTNKKKKLSILKLYENCKFDYILQTSIVNFISSIFSNHLENQLNKDVKKIIEFFLFEHLGDNLQTVQKIYWNQDFIFNLVNQAIEIKFDLNQAENGLLNLIENFGFGAGKNYYKKLPDFIILVYQKRNWLQVKDKLSQIIDLHFRALNTGKQAIDIEEHIQSGFQIILKFLESKKDIEDELQELKEIIVPNLLLQILSIFIEVNLPKQRNLFVLGINNVKHIPPQLCQFLKQLNDQESYQQITEKFLIIFKEFLDVRIGNLEQSEVQNIAIFNFYVIKMLEKCSLFEEILQISIEQFKNYFFQLCKEINENNFKSLYQKIYNLEFFFYEVCQEKQKSQIMLSQKVQDSLTIFDQNLQQLFISQIIKNEISDNLIQNISVLNYSELICQFLKTLNYYSNYSLILEEFKIQLNNENIQLNQNLKTSLVLFFYENQEGKKIITANEDLLGEQIENLMKNQSQKKPFFKHFMKDQTFQEIIIQIQDNVLKNNILEFTPILTSYININKDVKNLIENWKLIDQNDKINYQANFNVKLVYLILLLQNCSDQDEFKQICERIASLIKSNNDLEVITNKFGFLTKKIQFKILQVFIEIFFEKQKIDKNQKIFLKLYMNMYLTTKVTKKDITILEENFLKILKLQEKYNFSDFFRIVVQQFTKVINIDETTKNAYKIIDFSKFYQQPFLNENFFSFKKKQFWDHFIQQTISILLELEEDEQEIFNTEFSKILQKGFHQIYSFNFLRQVLKKYYLSSEKAEEDKLDKIFKTFEQFLKDYEQQKTFQQAIYFEQLLNIIPPFLKPQTYKFLDNKDAVKKDFNLNLILFIEKNQSVKYKIQNIDHDQQNKVIEEFSQKSSEIISKLKENEKMAFFEKSYLTLKMIQICLLNETEIILAENIEMIEEIFLQVLSASSDYFKEPYSQNCYFQMLKLLRKIITVLEMFSEQTQKTLLSQILTTSFDLVTNIKKLSENQTVVLEDFLEEISETISRFGLNEEQNFNINDILKLYDIEINSIKKSAFYLLKNIDYSLKLDIEKLNSLLPEDAFDYDLLLNFPGKFQEILTNSDNMPFSSFLLNWHILIFYCDGLTTNKKKNQNILSELFIKENQFFIKMLNRVFTYLSNKKLRERELQEILENSDLRVPEQNWQFYLTKETLKSFSLHIVFKIASMFPLSMRKWLNTADKKLVNFGYTIMKTKINEAIFEQEIENIELNQDQWQTEQFNIYLKKRTKEILLIYTQDDAFIELTLKIPDNYPLQGLDIKVNKTAMFSQSMLLKFKIMLVKLLNKENLNIVNAIVKWKDNVEKDFQGYEPCPICYYVIDSSDYSLPKKSCQHCQKKFHAKCIFKWFKTSGHSDCPMCKCNFL